MLHVCNILDNTTERVQMAYDDNIDICQKKWENCLNSDSSKKWNSFYTHYSMMIRLGEVRVSFSPLIYKRKVQCVSYQGTDR